MSRFKVTRPNQAINLKKWAPGRVAQMRLFLGHLEQAVNGSLAAQVLQSQKRKFSQFIPKIVPQDITTQVEFREIRVQFEEPRGLKDFLFYEAQLGLTENLFQFNLFTSPIPSFVFPGLVDNTTYYFRMRVVTKNGFVGPWSDTENATTPLSQAFGLFDGTEITSTIVIPNVFDTVFERTYTAIGGVAYYSIDYEIQVQIAGNETYNLEWSDVELRWLVDDEQEGQNFLVTTYGTNSTTGIGSDMDAITDDPDLAANDFILPGPFVLERRGTFIQKLTALTATATHTFKLEGKLVNPHPTPNDFQFTGGVTSPVYSSVALIKLRNFCVFEARTSG